MIWYLMYMIWQIYTARQIQTVRELNLYDFPSYQPILSFLNTPTCQRAKFLIPILKYLTTNEFTWEDSFYFAEEIVDLELKFFRITF